MNWQPSKGEIRYPILDAEAYHDARLVASGYDVYYLEQEWRDWWVDSGKLELGFPGKAGTMAIERRRVTGEFSPAIRGSTPTRTRPES